MYAKWKTRSNSFLWLHGKPGCGKTILSSSIVEDLAESGSYSQGLLYFYFDFIDPGKRTLEKMVRSLITQLCYKREDAWKLLDSLLSESEHRQPTCKSLCKCLLDMIQQAKEVWIVLDALDECTTREGSQTEGLLSWMKDILSSEQRNVHLLVTSRPEQDIESEISDWAQKDDAVPIQSDVIADDIRAYVHTRVREDKDLKRWRSRPDVQHEIESRILEKADGM
jgi:hypothetical protein